MGHVTHDGGLIFSKNVSSLALTVWERQCFEDWEEKDHSLNRPYHIHHIRRMCKIFRAGVKVYSEQMVFFGI